MLSEHSLIKVNRVSRATPLAPEERRQAIIAATLPLLLDQGPELTTREIARAAGVAEGTIFRAFGTKHELLHATICAALQPDAALAELTGLPANQPLAVRVERILTIVRDEIQRTRSIFVHLGATLRQDHPHGHRPPFPGGSPHEAKARLVEAATRALEPYATQLAVPAASAAHIITSLALAVGFITTDNRLEDPQDLANVVLYGIAKGDS